MGLVFSISNSFIKQIIGVQKNTFLREFGFSGQSEFLYTFKVNPV